MASDSTVLGEGLAPPLVWAYVGREAFPPCPNPMGVLTYRAAGSSSDSGSGWFLLPAVSGGK